MSLSESTILITGASQGLGRALAGYFGTRCRHVIVTARTESGLLHTVEDVRENEGSCEFVAADLTSPEDIANLAATLQERGDTVDILIHNAADVTSKPLADTGDEEIDSLLRTNIAGPLQLTRRLLPLMEDSESKVIVFISSLAGYKPDPSQTVYSISKAGVNAMAAALRAELGPKGFFIINAPLSSVDFGGASLPHSVPAEQVCRRIERAIVQREREIFLSPVSRVLMRLYGMFPGLMRF